MLQRDLRIDKQVARTLQVIDTDRNAEAVLTRINVYYLKGYRDRYPDGPEKNTPQDTLKLRRVGTQGTLSRLTWYTT